MPDIAKILKHNLVGKMFNHGCVFLINVLIVRLMGAGQSGSFFNELYFFNFIAFIASMGLDYSAIRYFGENNRLLKSINRVLLRVSMVSLVAFILFFILLPRLFNTSGSISNSFTATVFCIGNLLMILYQGVLSARKQFNLQNIVLAITNLGYLVFLFVVYQNHTSADVVLIAVSYSILFLIQGLILTLFSFKDQPDQDGDRIGFKPLMKHGIGIMCSSLIYFAFLRVDNFFVERYGTPNELGAYVQCGKIGQYFLYFSSIISSTILPFVRSEQIAVSLSEWKKLMKPYVGLLLLAAIGVAATGYWVFPFLFGNGFESMYPMMLIFIPGFFCLGLLTLMNAVYIGNNRIRKIFTGDLLGLVSVLVFDWIFIPTHGAMAAALISSSCYIAVFLYLLAGFKRNFIRPDIQQT